MTALATSLFPRRRVKVDAAAVLNSLPHPVLVTDRENRVVALNLAAEDFFDTSSTLMIGQPLTAYVPADNPLIALIAQARASGGSVAEYDCVIETMRLGVRQVSVDVGCVADDPDMMVISLIGRSIASKIDHQLTHRGAARSVTAMASMLAHEVKNPLSGIKGAAQLLDQTASSDDQVLTRLIVDEADRICALVDRMEVFSDSRPLKRSAVNIHQVLEHVRRIAQNGFGRRLHFVERYDPSLPAVAGNRDQLVQVFLNLVKNAAEACPEPGGEITLSTAYQHGVKLTVPGTGQRVDLPLVVTVQDNGDGVPEDLRQNLFDAFVTTKQNGTGLGLALVAKIVNDHGGVVEFDSQPGRTCFRVRLPVSPDEAEE